MSINHDQLYLLHDAIIEDTLTAKCGHSVEVIEVCEHCGQCIECCAASRDYVKQWPYGPGYKSEVLFIVKLRETDLENCQIGLVLQLLDNICHHCWDRLGGCQCWNDE